MSVADRLNDLSNSQYRVARVRVGNRVARVRVPRDATPEQAQEMAMRAIPRPKEKETSFLQGMAEGMQKPVTNALRLLGRANPIMNAAQQLGVAGNFGTDRTADMMDRQAQSAFARSGKQGSTLGRIAGGVVGTLPTLAIPGAGLGGALAQGAAGGLMMSNDIYNPKVAATDAGIGAAGGAIGYGLGNMVTRGAGRLIGGRKATAPLKPALSPKQAEYQNAVETLKQADILMTPGQRAGGFGRKLEDATDTLGTISQFTPMGSAKEGSLVDMNRAIYNEVLAPIGIKVNRSVSPGREAIRQLDDTVGAVYNRSAARLSLDMDAPLLERLNSYSDDALARMGPEDTAQLQANIKNVVNWRAGQNSGKQVTKLLGDLRSVASDANRNGKTALADTLWSMHNDVEEAAMRQSPQGAVNSFTKAREAMRRLIVFEKAGAKANDGIVTPGQFKTAVHQKGYGVTDKRLARGEAPMQTLADHAALVLPDKLPNSGTAERAAITSLATGGGLFGLGSVVGLPAVPAAGLGLASLAYTPTVNRFLQNGRNIAPNAINAGSAIARQAPNAARAASLGTIALGWPYFRD